MQISKKEILKVLTEIMRKSEIVGGEESKKIIIQLDNFESLIKILGFDLSYDRRIGYFIKNILYERRGKNE